MNYMISYDIGNNRVRKLVSDYLINNGFIRIQKSVFLGEVKVETYKKVVIYIETIIDKDRDNICSIPISKNDYLNIITMGNLENYKIYGVYNFWCWYLNVLTPFLVFFKKKMRQVNFPDKIKSPNNN